tara:strand:- start:1122 stop:2093 length:972 start_codon:yes stop_codon:yes gene_type:complete
VRPDLYQLLQVERSADPEELKAAFRRQARRFHPDRNQEQGADQRFKEVTYAYQVLSDPTRRAQYDRFGRVLSDGRDQGPFGAADDIDLASLMGTMFRDLFGSRSRKKHRASPQDLRYTVTISLMEAALGCQKEVNFKRKLPGGEQVEEKLRVRVPAGVDTGQKLKVRGKGRSGRDGDRQGDLYVVVNVADHGYFKRSGSDLFCDLPISYAQSVLGAELSVATLEGPAIIRIPPGTQPGAVLTLRGKGVTVLKQGQRSAPGDLYVKVLLDLPAQLSPQQREELLKLDQHLSGSTSALRKRYMEALDEYERLTTENANSTTEKAS